MLSDQAYGISLLTWLRHPSWTAQQKAYYLTGAALALWGIWQFSALAGSLLGTRIPESWSLEFAYPLTFVALLVPALKDRPTWIAALVGGSVGTLAWSLPYNLGLMVGAFSGIAAGLWAEKRTILQPDYMETVQS
jgi:predicted branched-subunit amino acid permease